MDFLTALVVLIIIIVVVYFTVTSGGGTGGEDDFLVALLAAAEVGTLYAIQTVLIPAIATMAFKMIVQVAIQAIITELVDDPALAMALSFLASAAIMSWDVQVGYTPDGAGTTPMFDGMGDMIGDVSAGPGSYSFSFDKVTSFSMLSPLQMTSLAISGFQGLQGLRMIQYERDLKDIETEYVEWEKGAAQQDKYIKELWQNIYGANTLPDPLNIIGKTLHGGGTGVRTPSMIHESQNNYHALATQGQTSFDTWFDFKLGVNHSPFS